MKEITEEDFVYLMNQIKSQMEHDEKCHEAFCTILPHDFVTGYDNNFLLSGIIKFLSSIFNYKGEMIDYFIFELEFGKKYEEGCVSWTNGENIKLGTINDLFQYLNANMKNN